MSEEVDLDELSREIENLRESVNCQKLCIGFLSIVVVLLLVQSFLKDPTGSSLLIVIGFVMIPIILVISQLEQRGL